ncbi:hypothetical protein B0A53_06092 [Rhodotorula sp. CCFEE 5036]|nr:hypothetical protein B0A53_06092 [Rhodotorula sp. CCFEE 5036]
MHVSAQRDFGALRKRDATPLPETSPHKACRVKREPRVVVRSLSSGTANTRRDALTTYVDKKVLVVTQDGRVIVGKLMGFDQTTNIILADSIERIFSVDEPVIEEPLGVEIVRGDNITLIGGLDEEADKEIDLSTIRAHPLADVTH